jgi:hypothetical protein
MGRSHSGDWFRVRLIWLRGKYLLERALADFRRLRQESGEEFSLEDFRSPRDLRDARGILRAVPSRPRHGQRRPHHPQVGGTSAAGRRRTEPAHLGSPEARSGRVSSLAFAGSERFDLEAVFAPGAGGPFDDPHVDATLGIGMLNGYRVQFDYAGGQIAFEPLESEAGAFSER